MVVDRLSKYVCFIPLKHSYTTEYVAKVILKEVISLHGFLDNIATDGNGVFLSIFWQELFSLLEIQLNTSSVYHP